MPPSPRTPIIRGHCRHHCCHCCRRHRHRRHSVSLLWLPPPPYSRLVSTLRLLICVWSCPCGHCIVVTAISLFDHIKVEERGSNRHCHLGLNCCHCQHIPLIPNERSEGRDVWRRTPIFSAAVLAGGDNGLPSWQVGMQWLLWRLALKLVCMIFHEIVCFMLICDGGCNDTNSANATTSPLGCAMWWHRDIY